MTDNIANKDRHRTTIVRTEAIMSAIMVMRELLTQEKEIGRVGSAYQTLRSVVYDMIEGAYWDGYTTGEDQAGRPVENPRKEPK